MPHLTTELAASLDLPYFRILVLENKTYQI